ncbi:MAG: hypothetical protein ACRYF4_04380 [Janthinobacterium lividum]
MNEHNVAFTTAASALSTHGPVATDEQVAILLAEHGSTADLNDAELLRLHAALDIYRGETLQWGERRSAVQPSLQPAAKRAERWAALPRWSLATVALVTILGGVARFAQYGPATDASSGEAATKTVQRTSVSADIAADDRLLLSINAELNYHSASPVDALGLQENDTPVTSSADGVTE